MKEAMEALLAGKKLAKERWHSNAYIHIEANGWVVDACGQSYALAPADTALMHIFDEPEPMVMRAKYLYAAQGGGVYDTSVYFKNDSEFLEIYSNTVWFRRLEEIECES